MSMNVNYRNLSMTVEGYVFLFVLTCRYSLPLFFFKYTSHRQKDLAYRCNVRIEKEKRKKKRKIIYKIFSSIIIFFILTSTIN